MNPPAELQGRGEAFGIFFAIVLELHFPEEQRRIGHAKIQASAIAQLLVAGPGARGIPVEHRKQHREVLVRLELQANARRREGIGRAAARQVDCGNRREVGLQENLACLAEEEFAVGRELSDPQARLVLPEFLFEPHFRQPRRRYGFDRGDRVHAPHVVAADAPGIVNLEAVCVEGQPLPVGKLLEIDRELRFELALIDRAALEAARHVAEHVVGVDEIVGDAMLGEPLADTARIAVVRQAVRNRRAGDPVRVRGSILRLRARGGEEEREGQPAPCRLQRRRAHPIHPAPRDRPC